MGNDNLDVPECLNKEMIFLQVKRNVPLTVDCQIDSMPLINITYQWTLWINTVENIGNYSISISNSSKLDVLKVVNDFLINQNKSTMTMLDKSKSNSNSYSALLLQCQAQSSIGQQRIPCLYMLHIYPGINLHYPI